MVEPGHARLLLPALLSACSLALGACSPSYVLRAGYEEARILWRRQPIAEVLADPNTGPELRGKLELTLAVREFAGDELDLRVGGSYSSIARVDADQVVHVVTAARRDRLEAYTWWFPILGRVPYRGFFDREDALALAGDLQREGYDTYVRPAIAFSTLGWFDDPLLTNLLRYPPSTLANVIVHELLHNTIYIGGEVAFNESFASFVGCKGAELFFAGRGDDHNAAQVRNECADEAAFSARLGELVSELDAAYARGTTLAERDEILHAFQDRIIETKWHTDRYVGVGWMKLNNAVVIHYWLYSRRHDLFARAHARNGNDLARTIAWVVELARREDDPFEALARALDESAPATAAPTAAEGRRARRPAPLNRPLRPCSRAPRGARGCSEPRQAGGSSRRAGP